MSTGVLIYARRASQNKGFSSSTEFNHSSRHKISDAFRYNGHGDVAAPNHETARRHARSPYSLRAPLKESTGQAKSRFASFTLTA